MLCKRIAEVTVFACVYVKPGIKHYAVAVGDFFVGFAVFAVNEVGNRLENKCGVVLNGVDGKGVVLFVVNRNGCVVFLCARK